MKTILASFLIFSMFAGSAFAECFVELSASDRPACPCPCPCPCVHVHRVCHHHHRHRCHRVHRCCPRFIPEPCDRVIHRRPSHYKISVLIPYEGPCAESMLPPPRPCHHRIIRARCIEQPQCGDYYVGPGDAIYN